MKTVTFLLSLFFLSSMLNAQSYKIRECVIQNGVLKTVEVDYNSSTGEKTLVVDGKVKTFSSTLTNEYAANASWFINNEMISFEGNKYQKYGLPRVLGVNEITMAGKYKDINVYVEYGLTGKAEVIYIPVRHGCEFQPYAIFIPPCGKVKITPSVQTVEAGKNVTITASVTEAKGKLNYSWKAYVGNIVGSSTSKSVVVSSKDVPVAIEMDLKISGNGCESNEYIKVPVKK